MKFKHCQNGYMRILNRISLSIYSDFLKKKLLRQKMQF